jgi:hypothetical protein
MRDVALHKEPQGWPFFATATWRESEGKGHWLRVRRAPRRNGRVRPHWCIEAHIVSFFLLLVVAGEEDEEGCVVGDESLSFFRLHGRGGAGGRDAFGGTHLFRPTVPSLPLTAQFVRTGPPPSLPFLSFTSSPSGSAFIECHRRRRRRRRLRRVSAPISTRSHRPVGPDKGRRLF